MRGRLDLRNDRGFSLSELVVVVGLLGVVLSASWAGLFAVMRSQEVSEAQVHRAKDFGDPLEQISSLAMQSMEIENAGPYRVDVWTDRDLDANPELNLLYCTSDGRLIWDYTEYQSDRSTVIEHRTIEFTDRCANQSRGEPLFTYYDKANAQVTDMTKAPSDTYFVRTYLSVETADGEVRHDTRDAWIRNKS